MSRSRSPWRGTSAAFHLRQPPFQLEPGAAPLWIRFAGQGAESYEQVSVMKSFTYTIVDPVGIHARPAGLLVKTAKAFSGTEISVTKGDKTVKSTQLMKLMGLGVKGGDTVTVTAEGPDEDSAISAMEQLFKENL